MAKLTDDEVRVVINFQVSARNGHRPSSQHYEFYDKTLVALAELIELRGMVVVLADHGIDWNRWHDLLDIRDKGGLSDSQQVEYDIIARVVEVLDMNEAGRVVGGDSERKE